MFDLKKLPENISKKTAGLSWKYDDSGRSDSDVLLFDELVLKIEKTTRSSEQERMLLEWLEGKLPIPKVIAFETCENYSFLLMSKMPGEMVCTGNSLKNMEKSVIAITDGLKAMWKIDISNCPFSETISDKLAYAKQNIENNLVDVNDFDPETLNQEGFSNANDLFDYLNRNRPKEDLVFSHGDYTFQNVLVSGYNITGLVDWGRGGIADRWQDIALIYRHLKNRHKKYGLYSERDYQNYKSLFFSELGLEPDEEKIRYFILMDELF